MIFNIFALSGLTPSRKGISASLVVLFGIIFFPAFGCLAVADSIPPSFSWILPAPYSVITTNSIRLAVNAHDDSAGSGIEKVTFFVRYIDFVEDRPKQIIGEVSKHPYEMIWDCSNILDQNFGKLRFSCTVTDHAGNRCDIDTEGRSEHSEFVLDRNPLISPARLFSRRTTKKIVLDGNLSEWAPADSLGFASSDNLII
ncbi:MAG: Ig-like domain-containing protein, partial [Candidatus Latescibacterota bacterium]